MGLFIRKPFSMLQAEANESGAKSLKRVLGAWSLVALGVGVIIGAGLFSITGTVAAGYTGPGPGGPPASVCPPSVPVPC